MSPAIIMLGTGDFALPTFEHLIETGHDVVALVTQPDRPAGPQARADPQPDQAVGAGAGNRRAAARGRQCGRVARRKSASSSPTCW